MSSIRRVLDYSRGPGFWSQLAVPAVFSTIVFSLWCAHLLLSSLSLVERPVTDSALSLSDRLALLWTSYELAAQPTSSLLAESVRTLSLSPVASVR